MSRARVRLVVIGLLAAVWLAACACAVLWSQAAGRRADALAHAMNAFQGALERAQVGVGAQSEFPEGRILDAVRAAWSERPELTADASDVLTAPPPAGR